MNNSNRKNKNRGFQSLRVWQDAIELYCLRYKIFSRFPFEMKRVASNAIDASHSISRNIAEGYGRKGIREYLNFLNIALGSCGEFHSCYFSFHKTGQISNDEFDKIDTLHYKVENQLLKLIESLQKKQINGEWDESLFKPID
jgi:four helix bundle protein